MKKITALLLSFCFIFSAFAVTGITSSAEAYATEMPEQKEHGFITARDGAKIEYAIYGNLNAEPLVMLPCNGNDMHNFDDTLLPEMAEHFKVITVSPRGTGASERGEGALTFDVESDDLLFMLDELGIEKTHLFGFSDGGNLAIVFAVQHGDRVLSLIPMGANINDRGTKITNQIGIVFEYWILCIQAKLSDDPAIALRRDIQGMMVGQPVLKFKDLEKINVPTLNIYGESDMMYRTHSKKITKSIPGAKELMVKGGGHSSCFDYTHEILIPEILSFYKENNILSPYDEAEKQALSLGFLWDKKDGVYYSASDPWLRHLGYDKYYDTLGGYVALWYDTVRIKFNYGEKDWLVQLWKGQYGFFFMGAEAGVSSKPENDNKALWDSDDSLGISFTCYNKGETFLKRSYAKTSWLTGFLPGKLDRYADRSQLTTEIQFAFEEEEMKQAFIEAIQEPGVGFSNGNSGDSDTYRVEGNSVILIWKTDRSKTS